MQRQLRARLGERWRIAIDPAQLCLSGRRGVNGGPPGAISFLFIRDRHRVERVVEIERPARDVPVFALVVPDLRRGQDTAVEVDGQVIPLGPGGLDVRQRIVRSLRRCRRRIRMAVVQTDPVLVRGPANQLVDSMLADLVLANDEIAGSKGQIVADLTVFAVLLGIEGRVAAKANRPGSVERGVDHAVFAPCGDHMRSERSRPSMVVSLVPGFPTGRKLTVLPADSRHPRSRAIDPVEIEEPAAVGGQAVKGHHKDNRTVRTVRHFLITNAQRIIDIERDKVSFEDGCAGERLSRDESRAVRPRPIELLWLEPGPYIFTEAIWCPWCRRRRFLREGLYCTD